MSTLLTDLASLVLVCADSTDGELPNYLKLHVLPRLPISPGLQVRRRRKPIHEWLCLGMKTSPCIPEHACTLTFAGTLWEVCIKQRLLKQILLSSRFRGHCAYRLLRLCRRA